MEVTVINFLPYSLEERKPGLIPERFYIPTAKNGKPGVLVIKDCASDLYIRDGKTFRIKHSAEDVATAICNDYNVAQLESDSEAHPAVFWVMGKVTANNLLTKPEYKEVIDEARSRQNKWFMRLINKADDDWSRWKQHRMITDIQRWAAEQMGQTQKEWYRSPTPETFIKCPACRSSVSMESAICHNCKYTVNEAKAIELGIKKVKPNA